MKALYSTYGEEDVVILIGRKKIDGVRKIKESEFILKDEIEEKYLIFAYTNEYKIFNNGIRHIYEVLIKDDLSNLKILYKNDEVNEVGVFTDKYISVYKRYIEKELENDVNKSIVVCGNFFNEKMEEVKYDEFREGELLYFYDGEELEFTLYLKGEEELEIPIKYEYLEEVKLVLSSIKKDDLCNDEEILQQILKGIYINIRSSLSKKNINSLGIVECD